MAVTKTKFINYIRCPSYVVLDKIKKEQLEADISIEDYKKEEQNNLIEELLNLMFDEEGNDLIDIDNKQLKVMLPYFTKIEIIAGLLVEKIFKGKTKYSNKILEQESFDCLINGIRYLCYVDIYNEVNKNINIIEVKGTTLGKFTKIGKSYTDYLGEKQIASIFAKDNDGIYRLKEEIDNIIFDDELLKTDYLKHKSKLFNKYNEAGHYVYDLAIQRFIIENDLIQSNQLDKIKNIKYYLAVLNEEYIFDGTYINNEPSYDTDNNGNDIVAFIDLTSVTKDYMDKIKIDQEKIEIYIKSMLYNECKVGEYCELKKATKCKYTPVCWNKVPNKNSILAYIDNHHGFTDEKGIKYDRYELINEGKTRMLDVPSSWLTREKNIIQRECVSTGKVYINANKIKKGLEQLRYPIYYLDFETFPCPLPRYRGEKPYSQSIFQFSLHVEKQEGVCDKDINHYAFLAENHNDCREELIRKLIECIDINSNALIIVYNQAFEKTRLKELATIFPQYKKELNKISDRIFDLLYLVKTNAKFYENLGFDENASKLFNYYHSDLNGSFSIKKVLPLFSDLSYDGLDVSDGMAAIVTYANFNNMSKDEYNKQYNALLEYCKQDTWAMVEILRGLTNIVK